MRKFAKALAVCLVLALSLVLFAACTQKEPAGVDKTTTAQKDAETTTTKAQTETLAKKVSIRLAHNWVGQDAKSAVMDNLIKQFQAQYPNIELQIETTPGMDHETKVKTDVAAGNTPEVFSFWGLGRLGSLAGAGKVADLTGIIQTDPDLKDRFLEGAFLGSLFNGKVYGLPCEAYFTGVFVNTSLFEKYNMKIPENFDELIEACKTLRANGIIPIAEGNKGGNANIFFNEIMYQAGGKNIVDDVMNKGDFSAFLVGIPRLHELVKAGAFPDDVNALGAEEKMALFNDEKAAMFYDGSWRISTIKPELQSKVDVITFPSFSDGKADPSGMQAGYAMYYAMAAEAMGDEAKKEAALKLMKHLTTPEANKRFLEEAAIPPCTKVQVDASKLLPVMVKGVALREKAKEITMPISDYYPSAIKNELKSVDVQAHFEALLTPESFVDKLSKGLKE